jgi:ribokinase
VVGHVEWLTFARVARLPEPGEIVLARASWEDACGGGGIAAVQMARLGGEAWLYTALGSDGNGARARDELEGRGVHVEAAVRSSPLRRAFTHLDDGGERTITVLGERLAPSGADPLDWAALDDFGAIYFTEGDAAAATAARRARVLVATSRAAGPLVEAGVQVDVLVHSAYDADEVAAAEALRPLPRHRVITRGADGGTWHGADGSTGTWRATEPPGRAVDAFGCGDSFAAGLAFGLGRGDSLEAALELAARCGASCLTGRGPYERQLQLAD